MTGLMVSERLQYWRATELLIVQIVTFLTLGTLKKPICTWRGLGSRVEQGHVYYQNNCIFVKIFHMSPQVTTKNERRRSTGISRYLGHVYMYFKLLL